MAKQLFARRCPTCRKVQEVTVEMDDYNRWFRQAGLVQDIFPYLTAAQREIFQSGICEPCWEKVFPDE